MPAEVLIGKYAIESLTTGMYTDPFVIYREYIQNAADSIDEAIKSKIIDINQAIIKVAIDSANRKIIIEDNGTGLRSASAYRVLSDIGNSQKIQGKNRGFRGIGRFSGLSYCDRLTFVTSHIDEPRQYSITYNAEELRRLIREKTDVLTASNAMQSVISERANACSASSHYFRVVMEGVHPETGLLDFDVTEHYLKAIAPVRYANAFSWAKVIRSEMKKYVRPIPEYRLLLETQGKRAEIIKEYQDTFLLNRQTGVTDQIHDIAFFPLVNQKGDSIGCVWYGISSFIGTIIGKEIKGLRLRSGNILIGDHATLNTVFKDSRFNGWVVGEVFVDSAEFVPNARRDDFEHNDAYYVLFEQLQSLAAEITKAIRVASVERNKALAQAVSALETAGESAEKILKDELVTPQRKGAASAKVTEARNMFAVPMTDELSEGIRQEALEQLDILTGKVKGASTYRALNLISGLTKAERALLEKIFGRIINTYDEEQSEQYINMTLQVLSEKAPEH